MKILLENGKKSLPHPIEVNLKDKIGRNPLWIIVMQCSGDLTIEKYLIENKIRIPNAFEHNDIDPLFPSEENIVRLKIIKLLVENDAKTW